LFFADKASCILVDGRRTSKEHPFRGGLLLFNPQNRGSTFPRNFGHYISSCMSSQTQQTAEY